jgi:hypothetical protein
MLAAFVLLRGAGWVGEKALEQIHVLRVPFSKATTPPSPNTPFTKGGPGIDIEVRWRCDAVFVCCRNFWGVKMGLFDQPIKKLTHTCPCPHFQPLCVWRPSQCCIPFQMGPIPINVCFGVYVGAYPLLHRRVCVFVSHLACKPHTSTHSAPLLTHYKSKGTFNFWTISGDAAGQPEAGLTRMLELATVACRGDKAYEEVRCDVVCLGYVVWKGRWRPAWPSERVEGFFSALLTTRCSHLSPFCPAIPAPSSAPSNARQTPSLSQTRRPARADTPA